MDYFEHVKNAVDVASRFTKPLTLSQFSEEFTNMISSLNSVIQMVDDAIPYCEVDDFNIAYLSCVLHAQVVALHLRYTILHNSGDLDRCVYLSDVSSQFWDHGDRLLLNHDACTDSICLWSWAHLDTTSLQAALESSSESSQRRVTGSFFCFVARAVRTAQGLSESSNSCDLSYQARIIKDLDDIATAVDTLTPHFDHDVRLLAQLLLCQGNALLAQFELSEDLTSLDRAIPVLEIALSLCDPTYSYDRNLISDALANALAKRYSGSQDSEDLDCVIKHAEARLLEAQDASLLRRIMVSRELASHLSYRFSDTGNPEDGDRVLQLCEETLLYITDEDYRTWSVIRGDVLLNQSSCGRRVADLAESLTYIHVAFDEIDASMVGAFLLFQLKIAVVSDDQERIDKLEQEMRDIWGKGDTIVHYYRFSKDSDTSLDTAIEVFRARFQASLSDDDPIRRQSSALMLMNMLYERFLRSHRPEDPRDALSIRSLSGMGPLGMYCIDINLLDVVNRDLDPIGMEERLTEALKVRRAQDYTLCGSCAVDFPHKGRESRRNMRNADMFFPFSFAMKPGSSTIQLQDLDSVRAKLLRSLSKATDLHQRRQDLSTLVDIHLLQYNRMHDFKDLDKAGDYLQDLVDGLDDDDESWDACNWRTNWAQMVFVRAGREGAPDKPKLLRALDQLMFVAKDTRHLFHHDRLITLQAWFKALVYAWEERNMHTLEMCELGLSLLEQQSWVASNTRLSIDTRFMVQDLLTTAVVTTLLADPDHLPRVIEILDAGQSLLWNQAARLREPLDKLASVDPKLASRFAQIMTSPAKTMDASKPYNWQLYEDRNKILEEIRVIPNFENFLKPRLFEDLIMASFEGPVVILLPSRLQCVSVILSMGRSTTLSLPISVATLRKMHGVLRVAVKTRGGTGTSGEDDISVSDSEWEELDTSIAGSSRSLRRQKGVKKLDMDDVLEQLWHGVAEPVIKGVLKQSIGPKGKEKAFSKPVSDPITLSRFIISPVIPRNTVIERVSGGAARESSPLCRFMLLECMAPHQFQCLTSLCHRTLLH